MPAERHQVNDHDIDKAVQLMMAALCDRLDEKGRGIFVSGHEILGVIVEELHEFEDEVKANNGEKQKQELLDLGVAILWGIVSRDSGKMDW